MINYACPKCGESLESPDSLAGANDQCPVCHAVCRVPMPKPSRRKALLASSLIALLAIGLMFSAVAYLRSKGYLGGRDPKAGMTPLAKLFVGNLRTAFATPEVQEDEDTTLLYSVPETYTLQITETGDASAPLAATLTIDMPTTVTAPPENLAAPPDQKATYHTLNSFTFKFTASGGTWNLVSAEDQVRTANGTAVDSAWNLPLDSTGYMGTRIRLAFDKAIAGQPLLPSALPQVAADPSPRLPPFPAAQPSPSVHSEDLGPLSDPTLGRFQTSDSRHMAWVVAHGDKKCVLVDGTPGPEFAGISNRGLTLSADGKHVAYIASQDARQHMVIDGAVGPAYDFPRPDLMATFSADGKRAAYAAQKNRQWIMVVDGKESSPHALFGPPIFSPDGSRLAYFVQDRGKYSLVVDDKPGPEFDSVGSPVFSPDGHRIACVASQDKHQFVVLDGKPGPAFDSVDNSPQFNPLTFSPDSQRLAYVATRGENTLMVLDGQPSPEYHYVGKPVFSPDSRHFAFQALLGLNDHLAVIDGQPHPEFSAIEPPLYSPDGKHLALLTQTGSRFVVMLDGQPGPKLQRAQNLLFSPDGNHLAYRAGTGSKWFVVRDGQPGPLFEYTAQNFGLGILSCDFSPDGSHLASIVVSRGKQLVVVDGRTGPEFDQIAALDTVYLGGTVHLTFDPDGTVVYLAIKDNRLYRVSQ